MLVKKKIKKIFALKFITGFLGKIMICRGSYDCLNIDQWLKDLRIRMGLIINLCYECLKRSVG